MTMKLLTEEGGATVSSKDCRIPPPPKDKGKDPLFRVIYAIDVGAANERKAAEIAWQMMRAEDAFDPIMVILESDGKQTKLDLCECGNCDWRGDVNKCSEIHRLLDRVETGGEFPTGECPRCGALTYLVRQTSDENKDIIPRVIISVSGGVADVVSKPFGVAVTLFDYDVDGVAENVSKDPKGKRCIISHWNAGIEVAPLKPKHKNHEEGKTS